jgi:hypothetical protein
MEEYQQIKLLKFNMSLAILGMIIYGYALFRMIKTAEIYFPVWLFFFSVIFVYWLEWSTAYYYFRKGVITLMSTVLLFIISLLQLEAFRTIWDLFYNQGIH